MYRVVPDSQTTDQVAALPDEALISYAEALVVLAVSPWGGDPQNRDNPDGAVRRLAFGPGSAGQVVYLILEDQREVHVVLVQWFG